MPLNFINKLSIFQELNATSVEESSTHVIITAIRLDIRPVCSCKSTKMHIHDWRIQTIKDLPVYNKPSIIKVRKQRYRCVECKKRITSKLSFCKKNKQISQRVSEDIPKLLKRQNFTDCAINLGISISSVLRVFKAIEETIPNTENIEVLHIDEFKGTSRAGKYQTLLVDGIRRKVIDVLPTRNQTDLIDYFKKFKKAPKICVIDMWHPFYRAIKTVWKDTIIIADKFHYVRQIVWKVRNIRLELQKLPELKILKKYWKLFMINSNNLSFKQVERLNQLISLHPILNSIYRAKYIFDTTVSNKKGDRAHAAFDNWLDSLKASNIPALLDLLMTFENWYAEVVTSFYYSNNNGIIEGFNNKVKTIKRQSYGIKNFYNLRKLILLKVS